MKPRTSKPSQRGFSLVEVIIALALLGAVLISLSGLFVLGTRKVQSGRAHSEALAVARDMLEQMNGWQYHQTYWQFGPAYDGDAEFYTFYTNTPGYADAWQPALDELSGGYGKIHIESVHDPADPQPKLKDAKALRIVVTIYWDDGLRSRNVELATVRM